MIAKFRAWLARPDIEMLVVGMALGAGLLAVIIDVGVNP